MHAEIHTSRSKDFVLSIISIAMFYTVVNGSELGSTVIIQVNMQALPTI